jgi:hypothetical protein
LSPQLIFVIEVEVGDRECDMKGYSTERKESAIQKMMHDGSLLKLENPTNLVKYFRRLADTGCAA